MVGTELDQNLHRWLKGDRSAIELAKMFGEISQIWDDLVDGDKAVGVPEINFLMRLALIEIPKNLFYQQHFNSLHPVMEEKIYTWLDCNLIEDAGNYRQLQAAYILRSVVTDLVIHLAYLVGGFDWRQAMAFEIRDAIYSENESLQEYVQEHRSRD